MWYSRLTSRRRKTKKVRAPKARLWMEYLEDRNLLSTFVVDRLTDVNPTGGGEGSGLVGDLRYAIHQANTLPGDDGITFSVTGSIDLSSALPALSTNLELQGPGANSLTVQRSSAPDTPLLRIFLVSSGATVIISGLTVARGHFNLGGGGIYNAGDLTLSNCTVTQCTSLGGGGGIFSIGNLSVSGCTIDGNIAYSGGGVVNFEGTATLTSCNITNNIATTERGGGIRNDAANSDRGVMTLTGCTIAGNRVERSAASFGGGIWHNGGAATRTLTLNNCRVANNMSSADGGGIDVYLGTFVLSGSTVQGNITDFGGGGGVSIGSNSTATLLNSTIINNRAVAGGGIRQAGWPMSITNCTIAGNTARWGGGMTAYTIKDYVVTITNSTFSGNQATQTDGGGIWANNPRLLIAHSTFTANTAAGGRGGAIYFQRFTQEASIQLHHTIVSLNTAGTGPNLHGPMTSLGYNLIGITAGSTGWLPSDLLNQLPSLGPLQNNGGPTDTHALLPSSRALDAGDPGFGPPPSTDQRGLPRVVDGRVDIGAYEVQLSQQVVSFLPTPTGFKAQLSRPFEASVLNLYDSQNAGLGAADVVVTGASSGPVAGSLVVDPVTNQVTFVRTGGVLPPDTYTVTLRSAANGFRTTGGALLDGDGNGTPGGDFVTTFTVAPSTDAVVSVPDFARGRGQAVTVPATSSAAGIPLQLSNGAGVTSITLTLLYNPALLSITGATPIAGATANVNTSTPGQAVLTFSSSTPLPSGAIDFVRLTAAVPIPAPYGSKHVLDLTDILLNNGAIVARDDDGLHISGYFGDTSGSASLSSSDALLAQRVAVGLDSGFDAWQLTDPVVIADITGNGLLNSTDALRILQEAVGLDRPEIPPISAILAPIVLGGPDPLLSIPKTFRARPGGTITVPVNLDLSDGLQTADLAISYDPSRLEVLGVTRGSLTGDFDLFAVNSDVRDGTLRVGLGRSAGPLSGRGSGSVLEITFRVREDAPAGPSIINLRHGVDSTLTQLNEGGLDLIPDPNDEAGDALDGQVAILRRPGRRPSPGRDLDGGLVTALLEKQRLHRPGRLTDRHADVPSSANVDAFFSKGVASEPSGAVFPVTA